MNNLLNTLLTVIKAKITPLVTKFKLWTSWDFIRTQILTKFREFFAKLLDIRPRHKKDYYEFFGWLISRRLVFALVIVIGVLSLVYFVGIQDNLILGRTEGLPTYKYNSLMLRFTEDRVRIKAKDDYIAYEGDVAKGKVVGNGILFNKEGVVVYQGSFDNNEYNGQGTSFYDDGTMEYTGTFQSNIFEGQGKLYRPNGSLEYEGAFVQGMKEGQGTLFDNASKMLYTGAFSRDEIVYSNLLGMAVSDVAKVYNGSRSLYEGEDGFAAVLGDISAMYVGRADEEALEDEMTVESVFVMKNEFPVGNQKCSRIEELTDFFGAPDYEGNSSVTMPEAVVLNWMVDKGIIKADGVEMELSSEFSDYQIVEGFDSEYTIYLYSYHNSGLVYTFACQDRDGEFLFYWIEAEEGGATE